MNMTLVAAALTPRETGLTSSVDAEGRPRPVIDDFATAGCSLDGVLRDLFDGEWDIHPGQDLRQLDEPFLIVLATLRAGLVARDPGSAEGGASRLIALRRAIRAGAARNDPDIRQRLEFKAKLISDLLERYGKLPPKEGLEGPTPETRVKRRRIADPIERLHADGRLDDSQLLAAHRLRRVIEAVTLPVSARTQRFDGVPGQGTPPPLLPGETAADHANCYLPWVAEVKGWVRRGRYRPMDMILEIIVDGMGVDTARRKHGCAYATAFSDLSEGLTLYARYAGVNAYLKRKHEKKQS